MVSAVKLLRSVSGLQGHFTTIFYDWSNIAHGVSALTYLAASRDYRSKGFRIENWPYCTPIPMSLKDSDFASPQAWCNWKITATIKQFCHPVTSARLRLVCWANDMTCMPFMMHPNDASGNPGPDPIDFPHVQFPNTLKHTTFMCYCALHRGTGDYMGQDLTPVNEESTPQASHLKVAKPAIGKKQIKGKSKTHASATHVMWPKTSNCVTHDPHEDDDNCTLTTIQESAEEGTPLPVIRNLCNGKQVTILASHSDEEESAPLDDIDRHPMNVCKCKKMKNNDSDSEMFPPSKKNKVGQAEFLTSIINASCNTSTTTLHCTYITQFNKMMLGCFKYDPLGKLIAGPSQMVANAEALASGPPVAIASIPPPGDVDCANTIGPLEDWHCCCDIVIWVSFIMMKIELQWEQGFPQEKCELYYKCALAKWQKLCDQLKQAPFWDSFDAILADTIELEGLAAQDPSSCTTLDQETLHLTSLLSSERFKASMLTHNLSNEVMEPLTSCLMQWMPLQVVHQDCNIFSSQVPQEEPASDDDNIFGQTI
ncbi:hypothetical protein K439DRAFT_1615446 [Ramaria rubella]|nr:hypothetical protein K439DRAFT_1615446 [Ramaria rubella]